VLVRGRWGCDLCRRNEFVPAVGLFTDRFGFVYGLCVEHYPGLKLWVEGPTQDGQPRGSVRLLPEAHTGEWAQP
jgi:hypothetical protein